MAKTKTAPQRAPTSIADLERQRLEMLIDDPRGRALGRPGPALGVRPPVIANPSEITRRALDVLPAPALRELLSLSTVEQRKQWREDHEDEAAEEDARLRDEAKRWATIASQLDAVLAEMNASDHARPDDVFRLEQVRRHAEQTTEQRVRVSESKRPGAREITAIIKARLCVLADRLGWNRGELADLIVAAREDFEWGGDRAETLAFEYDWTDEERFYNSERDDLIQWLKDAGV